MDTYRALIIVALQKEIEKKQKLSMKPCYMTKFSAPKKESKQKKELSDNIKKFLIKKEEEERRKAEEDKSENENLQALQDHKTQTRLKKNLRSAKRILPFWLIPGIRKIHLLMMIIVTSLKRHLNFTTN